MSSVGIHGRTSTAPTAQERGSGTTLGEKDRMALRERGHMALGEVGCKALGEVDGWHLRTIPEIYTLKIDVNGRERCFAKRECGW